MHTGISKRISLIALALVCAVLVCTLIFSLWATQAHDEQDGLSLAMISSSTIPYVTDTSEFIAYLHDTLEDKSPQEVQAHIRALYADDQYGEQHTSFHYFGEVLYASHGASALPLCEDSFGYGCYHGFLLGAIEGQGYAVVPELDAACIQAHGYTLETETCQHGIGHGLLEVSRLDPHKAIEACDMVDDVYPKLGCASGVFMEYFSPTQSGSRSGLSEKPAFDEQNPLGICSDFTGMRRATCLFEIQSWWEEVGKLAPRTVEALCNSVEDAQAREFCLIGYGNYKGPYIAEALPYCEQFTGFESRALCKAGVLWAAEHHYDRNNPGSACGGLSREHQEMCFQKGRFTCEIEGSCKPEIPFL